MSSLSITACSGLELTHAQWVFFNGECFVVALSCLSTLPVFVGVLLGFFHSFSLSGQWPLVALLRGCACAGFFATFFMVNATFCFYKIYFRVF